MNLNSRKLLIKSMDSEIPDREVITQSIIEMVLNGISINWQNYYRKTTLNKIDAPAYAFLRSRYWPKELDGKLPGPHAKDTLRKINDSGKFNEEQLIWLTQLLSNEEPEANEEPTETNIKPTKQDITSKLSSALSEDRKELLNEYLVSLAMRIMKVDESQLAEGYSLIALGLDSLMAIRFRDLIFDDLAIDLDVLIFMDEVDIATMAKTVLKLWEADNQESNPQMNAVDQAEEGEITILENLDDLSPEEVEQLLSQLSQTDQ